MKRLATYHELIGTLLIRDLKVRYKQTALGVAWSILQPLSTAAVLSAVFSPFVGSTGAPYPYFLYVYTGVLSWNLMVTGLTVGSSSVVGHASLLGKVAFPREVFPVSAVLVNLVDYGVGLAVLFAAALLTGHAPPWTVVALPAIVAVELLLTAGMTMLLAAVMVFFRDVRYVLPLAVTLWMFLTPVFYPVARLSQHVRAVVAWNPMSAIVEMHRAVLLDGHFPEAATLGALAALAAALFLISYALFKRWEPHFAEVV